MPCFALLILARPEGWLLCAGYVAAIVLAGAPQRGLGASIRAHASVVAALTVLVVLYFVGRKVVYGEFLGNPYYVKSANRIFGSRGSLLPGLSLVTLAVLFAISLLVRGMFMVFLAFKLRGARHHAAAVPA